MEVWKEVIGWEGHYEVSSCGRVRTLKHMSLKRTGQLYLVKARVLKPIKTDDGYFKVSLFADQGKFKQKRIHRLVAEAFLANPENKPQINHKDGNKLNNILENLEWVTHRENADHAQRTGLLRPPLGSKHGRSKLKEADVIKIRELYSSGSCTQHKLAVQFDVSLSSIANIITRRYWRHI